MSAVTGIAGISSEMVNFVQILREMLRDKPELNRLIRGEESSDRLLYMAANLAVVRYLGTPPISEGLTLADLMRMNQQDVLLDLAILQILKSVMLLQARNQINYSSGGTTVGINDKALLLLKLFQTLESTTSQELKTRKTALNIISILGETGVHSEYAVLHNSYVFW